MRTLCIPFYLTIFILCCAAIESCSPKEVDQKDWAIVIHGGAGGRWETKEDGTRVPVRYSSEREERFLEELNKARVLGENMLKEGHSALDVAEAVVVFMENCPLFNAGKGAVMTIDRIHELDAAVMDGSNLEAGAVAGVKDVKNPIKLARKVMEKSPHVFLIGEGASSFAKEQELEIVENSYFTVDSRRAELQNIIEKRAEGNPMGTVGCVVLDKKGNLAAATSTGGMSGKKWGRVGDVPVIGAGTYANNRQVAVSGTGHGELWIRSVVAYDIYSQMEYKGASLKEAAYDVIWNKIDKMEGSGGGVICVDKFGNIVMEYNTPMMYRAWSDSSGEKGAAIFE